MYVRTVVCVLLSSNIWGNRPFQHKYGYIRDEFGVINDDDDIIAVIALN